MTEHEIQKGLRGLMKGRTSILIAHRLSTIMSADRIVVLDKGRVIQEGRHQELIRQNGLYKKLWNLQKGGYIE
jgi:ABC-type multidrug transport system fused ATPase/permease subunit